MKVVTVPSRIVLAVSALAAAAVVAMGWSTPFPPIILAVEVAATVLGLFLLSSFTYRVDKNALSFGAAAIVAATFWTAWWPADRPSALTPFIIHHFFTFEGLEHLIHVDTLLFIVGLTFFVAVVGQTRLFHSASLRILRGAGGRLFLSVALITGLVAVLSGILDGVSMVGLLIRVLITILVLARVADGDRLFFIIVSTMITTICGVWLAYGEPPNLIMKANLSPQLTDGFFLRYGLPVAIASYGVLWFHMRRRLAGRTVSAAEMSRAEADLMGSVDPRLLRTSQRWALFSFVPFVVLLIAHALNKNAPLFLASTAGCLAALPALRRLPDQRRTALHDGLHECREYLFLIPLFFSISLLTKTGLFEDLSTWIQAGAARWGTSEMAFIQLTGATFLSAVLDNNVVADIASRALHGLPTATLHLFALAQIAGYALGGCWTHIGSAQSVVAFAFIQKNVRETFTPWDWIRAVTPVLLQVFAVATALIFIEGWLLGR